MKKINSYIIEKLHINKNSKANYVVEYPTNKNEWIDFIDKYFKEWYFSEEENKGTKKPYEKYYLMEKDYIVKKIESGDFSEYSYLPIKFLKYMNTKYGMKFHITEKLHITKNTKTLNTDLAKEVFDYIFSGQENDEIINVFAKYFNENNIDTIMGYHDNVAKYGAKHNSDNVEIEWSNKGVHYYVSKLTEDTVTLKSLYGSKTISIITNELEKETEKPVLYISTIDTRFILLNASKK